MCVQISLRTSSGVLQRRMSICKVCFTERRSNSTFHLPIVDFSQVLFGKLLGIQKRRYHNNGFAAKASLLDVNTAFTNREILGQHFLSLPAERSNLRPLPANNVIFFTQSLSFSKVGLPHRLQLSDGIDASLLERQ